MSRGLRALARQRLIAVEQARQALARELEELNRLERLLEGTRREHETRRRQSVAALTRPRRAVVLHTEHAWLTALELRIRRLEEERDACFDRMRRARHELLEAEQAQQAVDTITARRAKREARRLALLEEGRAEVVAQLAKQGKQR